MFRYFMIQTDALVSDLIYYEPYWVKRKTKNNDM